MIFISVTFCSSPQGQKAEGYDLPWDLVLLLVLVLGDLRQGGLDEVALHVTDGDGELVDLEVAANLFSYLKTFFRVCLMNFCPSCH